MLMNEQINLQIRQAKTTDAAALLKIYEPYVLHTAVTFEYEVPAAAEFKKRIVNTLTRYPYLVALINGNPVGYAYASAFKGRSAYDWSAETSIYVSADCHRLGIGRCLYRKLEQLLTLQNICNLYACIAYPNPDSIAFHQAEGYKTISHFTKCGYKLNNWYDMIFMEKFLADHEQYPKTFIPYQKLALGQVF